MKLETRVFELASGKYKSLYELAQAMGAPTEISFSQVYRVREGKRSISEKFIIGAVKAFPDKKLDELFYIAPEGQSKRVRQIVKESPAPQKPEGMLTTREVSRLLNVHINTVRRWGNRGMLKTYYLGNRRDRRFRREDVDDFLLKGKGKWGHKI